MLDHPLGRLPFVRAPLRCAIAVAAVAALGPACTSTTPSTESDADRCSNGRDDDGDLLIDCRDPACTVFPFCGSDAGADAGADAPLVDTAGNDVPITCAQPVDVVLVLDVSGTMDEELTAIQAAVPAVFEHARALDPSAQLSLAVFVDDVLLVNGCAPFASATDLVAAIEAYRVIAPMNHNVVATTLVNRDCPENSLDALFDAATTCSFRAGAARVMWHATDDTFVERPGVLSGEWGGGVFVASTYAEVATALRSRDIHLASLAWSGAGQFCGAGASADTGAGFFTPWAESMPALPEASAGIVWDGRMLATLDMARDVNALIDRLHACD